jgi:hypothetical protein
MAYPNLADIEPIFLILTDPVSSFPPVPELFLELIIVLSSDEKSYFPSTPRTILLENCF